jgi:hypothetical protein
MVLITKDRDFERLKDVGLRLEREHDRRKQLASLTLERGATLLLLVSSLSIFIPLFEGRICGYHFISYSNYKNLGFKLPGLLY